MNVFLRSFSAARRAAASSVSAETFSMSVRTSPRPRSRDAARSGWNGSRSATFSPVPVNFSGLPTTFASESAAPPRASPSVFVRMTPVSGSFAANASAERTASCPVIASATKRISSGSVASRMRATSSIRTSSTWSRPAVSTIATSYPKSFASFTAARARATASVDPFGSNAMRPFSFASVRSCSVAAGRWTSAGTRSTCLPKLFLRWSASLAAVVVLPEPCRPDEEDHGRALLDRERRLLAAEDGRQLVPDDLDDLLGRRKGGQDLLPHGLLPHGGREVLDDGEVDVGLEERGPDLLERLVDVELGQVAFAAQLLEDTLQPVGKGFEHRRRGVYQAADSGQVTDRLDRTDNSRILSGKLEAE